MRKRGYFRKPMTSYADYRARKKGMEKLYSTEGIEIDSREPECPYCGSPMDDSGNCPSQGLHKAYKQDDFL